MATQGKKDKPEKEAKAEKMADVKAAKKEAAATVAAAQKTAPLRVEVTFPSITDLKQGISFDSDGNLQIMIQFKAPVNQYEIFRLVNLLKQPHGAMYATIGSPQTQMDFHFTRDGKVEIVKAQLAAEKPKPALATGKKGEPAAAPAVQEEVIIFQGVAFNHIPTEDRPFGVLIDFTDGSEKTHTVAGRGESATEAVITGVRNTKGPFESLEQPFEIVEALKRTPETDARLKIIRAIERGSFDDKPTVPTK